jgi:adenylylsulfate reductase subunit A
MGGCGATYESRYWGRDLKIVCVEKANIERSGAVATGSMRSTVIWAMNENQPEDHVRYARNDLMGLGGGSGRRHRSACRPTVHKFEGGASHHEGPGNRQRYQREGKWQIMIHGESYKPIVAEAARKAATEVYNRIMVTHLLMDATRPNRVAAAPGFNVRNGNSRVPRRGGHRRRWRIAHFQAPRGRRGHGTHSGTPCGAAAPPTRCRSGRLR